MIKTADVIVIGSGIVGSATAYELAKRGKSVLVLEKYPNVGDGASSRNGAGVRLAGRVSPEAELAAMAIYDIWPTLGEELDADLEYVVGGSLTMAHSESQMKSLQVKLAKDLKANVPSRIVDGNETREICPILSDYVEQALYSEMDGHANPMVTTLAYYRAARRLGVDYITGENVIALEKMHGCCRKVLTEAGNVYEAEHIVLAAGFNSRRIAKTVGLWIPFLKRVDECLITEVQPPMTKVRLSSADGNFYGSQTKHGSFIFGGNTNLERYEECYDDRPINTGKQSPDKCRAIGKFIPALKDVKVVRHWAGWLDSMVDRLPIIQEIPEVPGLVLACGFSGHGFAIGPAVGKIVTQIVMGEPTSVDVSALDYERFKPTGV